MMHLNFTYKDFKFFSFISDMIMSRFQPQKMRAAKICLCIESRLSPINMKTISLTDK